MGNPQNDPFPLNQARSRRVCMRKSGNTIATVAIDPTEGKKMSENLKSKIVTQGVQRSHQSTRLLSDWQLLNYTLTKETTNKSQ
ncbi:hypothetical protein [Nostoc sp.]|uniref:hypothetical protein n=1 Tax=Nostoc sp. TaxID=1180 RepID=UPI002FFAF7F1